MGWTFRKASSGDYSYELDSMVKQQGKYAVSITSKNATGDFGSIGINIPYRFNGNEIELRGYIKTENINKGFAGFWLRIDGTLAFNNMQNQNVHGTTDWREYSIKLPYDSDKGTNIAAGALLVGGGKIWFDHVQLLIDGKPIENAIIKKIVLTKAEQDTVFNKSSGITNIKLDAQQLKNLTLLGKVWGFIKYHHPEVAKGNVNMDAELFRVLPAVIKARNNQELSSILEQWIGKFGKIQTCDNCKPDSEDKAKLALKLGDSPENWGLSKTLIDKLIALNKSNNSENYYVDTAPNVGNPIFNHEKGYEFMQYPDAGYRLLSLYRYWNMIQYFSPYKHLIGEDWNKVLPAFIPQFINDADNTAYTLTVLALISSINDTHANIWGYRKELEDYRGKFAPPFKAKFIEDKLVVTGFYNDTLNVKSKFKLADVITSINGVKVTELIKKFLPITAASNYSTQLRDMPNNYLLRSNNPHFDFVIERDGKTLNTSIAGLERKSVNYRLDYDPNTGTSGYYVIDKQIGYLYPAKYYNKDLPDIKKMFNGTKGIIVDMRCYPSEFMPFTFVPYIKSGNAPFVKFTNGSVTHPGSFTETPTLSVDPTNEYKGKVIVIVNEQTQSQAEYTTMAFQSSPNVTVIGSTTAGADGNVSPIILPGGISTMISGIGILYPDGAETQRKGVKIDVKISPTIKGIKAGIDEPLEKAKQLILNEVSK
ncbi:S41 family peptidase [Mucilaginibacter sabulilitoris]|uniref:S41 family peptidase n=1 Tax=Mucilaginibacter sabulilitoris TaxID=1173583 RepID=A0ABZ0TH94_9SPHI|nr:S41 family peptidase [Mucilaginibacter sabulilitoris]WPU90950.1 S41 family peptidase [Mucilaginibacter sabulilitoris]